MAEAILNTLDYQTPLKNNVIPFPGVTADIKTQQNPVQLLDALPFELDMPTDYEEIEEAEEHYAHPFKNPEDIARISNYFLARKKYRNNALFILGTNLGLRFSDLRLLKPKHFINADMTFKSRFSMVEKKTKNTRKHKQNRHLTVNRAMQDALILLLRNKNIGYDDYLFMSESNFNRNDLGQEPLQRQSVDGIIKKVTADLGIEGRFATHTLRKTFGYQIVLQYGHDERVLSMLQQIYGHRKQQDTLRYLGFTEDEISNIYLNLNLGYAATGTK